MLPCTVRFNQELFKGNGQPLSILWSLRTQILSYDSSGAIETPFSVFLAFCPLFYPLNFSLPIVLMIHSLVINFAGVCGNNNNNHGLMTH